MKLRYILTTFLLVSALLFLSLASGSQHANVFDVIHYFSATEVVSEQAAIIIETLRIPRTLAIILVGSGLAIATCMLQVTTKNPLADPGLLGVNAGAVFSLVIGLTFYNITSGWQYFIWAISGAICANIVILLFANRLGTLNPLRLILAGIALNSLLHGASNYLLLSSQIVLEQFRYWNLGSFSGIENHIILIAAPLFFIGMIITLILSRQLSLLQLGEIQATSLGVNTHLTRLGVLITISILTGLSVAIAGPISFVGFVSAYCARQIYPTAIQAQLILSAVLGVILCSTADIIARYIIQPYELPSSILLALFGVPTLLWVIKRHHMNVTFQ